jgi:hypothetical protein
VQPNFPLKASAISLIECSNERCRCVVLRLSKEHLAGIGVRVLARPTRDEEPKQGGNDGASNEFVGQATVANVSSASQHLLGHHQRADLVSASFKTGVVEPCSEPASKTGVDGVTAGFRATKDV